ncbi:MAG TPA: hypothetical protein PLE17_06375 [Soehngenia sp.]|nr:hypothetical protein [Soehngenia sp.]
MNSFLINSTHEYAIEKEELIKHKTDGHMDINKTRAGAVVIAPLK